MDEILATGSVRDIAATIRACNFSQEAFILTENFPSYPVNDQRKRQHLLRFVRLKDGLDKDGFDVNQTTSGRVFLPDFELRWEKKGHEYRVIYLGTPREIPKLETNEKLRALLDELEPHEDAKRYYLFGEVLAPDDPDEHKAKNVKAMGIEETTAYYTYAEVRIPRLLRYPPASETSQPKEARRVQLVICEYTDKATGSVQLFRFQDLRPEEEKKSEEEEKSNESL